tara:strand:+ start:132 stop:1199 length:1068 start_codon:yes stop_codon:yes gene_type:complete
MSSDARDAYIAGKSGSTTYTPPSTSDGTDAGSAFAAGVASTQSDKPEIFQDTVSQQDGGSFVVDKNPLQQQLDNLQNQDQAFEFINTLNQLDTGGTGGMGILNPNILGYIKDPLVALGAFTTDMDESRNVYQLLINKMFQGDDERMRGALPLNQSAVQGMRRLGRNLFRDPNVDVSFGQNLMSLLPGVKNPGVVNIMDMPGGGIAELPEFGQAGLDFTKEQGFRNYGKIIENLITGATPLKYGKFLFDKTKEKLGGTDDDNEDEISKLIDSISVDDGSFEVAELTDKQKDFIKKQSFAIKEGLKTPSSVFETINNPNLGIFKKPFFGIGGQDPTTVEEFNEYLKSLDQTMPTIIT